MCNNIENHENVHYVRIMITNRVLRTRKLQGKLLSTLSVGLVFTMKIGRYRPEVNSVTRRIFVFGHVYLLFCDKRIFMDFFTEVYIFTNIILRWDSRRVQVFQEIIFVQSKRYYLPTWLCSFPKHCYLINRSIDR